MIGQCGETYFAGYEKQVSEVWEVEGMLTAIISICLS